MRNFRRLAVLPTSVKLSREVLILKRDNRSELGSYWPISTTLAKVAYVNIFNFKKCLEISSMFIDLEGRWLRMNVKKNVIDRK